MWKIEEVSHGLNYIYNSRLNLNTENPNLWIKSFVYLDNLHHIFGILSLCLTDITF